ncbi:hypothetical protein LOK49_LG07G01315 [Camellia lanceoleosa]|uniref:Uncharacterized protein n=1 Tax=Camellia lanceoleosa TaxID=1840588 RepID=A0ACC0H6A1_9ERIC|nr:hypothetical protein LOK49_LG07G01315 [Camellia lanceoleosa]
MRFQYLVLKSSTHKFYDCQWSSDSECFRCLSFPPQFLFVELVLDQQRLLLVQVKPS